jgi:hypothetical protein
MALETNTIEEISPGIYHLLLWCPESGLLRELLDLKKPYVLCWDFDIGNYSWADFALPLFDPREPIRVLSRMACFDFILPTEQFLRILPRMRPAIKAVQLDKMPPDYLDMKRIKGNQLYQILNDCGWHVLLDTPANDYGRILSPNRSVLERAIQVTQSQTN